MTGPELQHGSLTHRRPTAPEIGARIAVDGIATDLVPAKTYEVNFKADVDVVTMALGPSSGVKAFDSDKTSTFTFCPGEMYFHPSGSAVYARSDRQDGELVCLVFDKHARRTVLDDLRIPASRIDGCLGNLRTPDVLNIARLARRMFLSGRVQNKLLSETLLTLVLAELAAALTTQPQGTNPTGTLNVDRALEYIEANLAENIGLNEIAQALGVSPYHFSRGFKSNTGLSPHQYVLERRVARAREMLAGGHTTLAEIAYAVGFSSQAHMTDVFRKRLGITPGAYRKEMAS